MSTIPRIEENAGLFMNIKDAHMREQQPVPVPVKTLLTVGVEAPIPTLACIASAMSFTLLCCDAWSTTETLSVPVGFVSVSSDVG